MSVKFRDVKLSVGVTTSMNLQFTRKHYTPVGSFRNSPPVATAASGSVTVSLGLFQVPSLMQREDSAAPAPAASGESAQTAVGVDNVPHVVTPQSSGLVRNPSIISRMLPLFSDSSKNPDDSVIVSGTATIFPRKKAEVDLHPGNSDSE